MAAPMEYQCNVKLTKSERKLRKKLVKSQNVLLKHDGIKTSDTPTKILCAHNAGLDTGMSRDEVYGIFGNHGNIEDIIMMPQKPYAFVCYSSETEAETAHSNLNGTKLCPSAEGSPSVSLYVSYVCEVPSSLCPTKDLPPGLFLLENFVSEEEEEAILKAINWEENVSSAQQRDLKHRQVKHYGFEFKYGINDVDINDPLPDGIPSVCEGLLTRALQTGHVHHLPDQLTVNKYQPGQGIPPHVDTPPAFEDGIMSLSLGSQVLMDYRHPEGQHLSVLLPPRSLLIMTKESRYVWSHGITPRKSDIIPTQGGLTLIPRGTRTSLTFRKIIHPKERLKRRIPFIDDKESADQQQPMPESDRDAAQLECLHVHKVYEEIADHFSGTRHSPWPRITEFIEKQPPGSFLADIGCGNGKYLGINSNVFKIGSDRSTNLTKICRERNHQVFVADIMSIPLRSSSIDVCLCIAVLHHLSTQERRLHGLSELLRILRPGGQALIYVWAMEQELHKVKSKYLKEVKIDQSFGQDQANCDRQLCCDGTPNESVCSSLEKVCLQEKSSEMDGKENSLTLKTDNTVTQLTESNVVRSAEAGEASCDIRSSVTERDIDEQTRPCDFEQTCDSHDNALDKAQIDNNCVNSGKNVSSVESSHMKQATARSKTLGVHKNRTQFKQQDMLVPWQLKTKDNVKVDSEEGACKAPGKTDPVFHRYYHVFKQGELEELCLKLNNCKIAGGYYDQGNWAVILQKL